ncbi:MAG: methenyltetrahydromethanopterin cyclohydrolase [Anaerolineae bacterium]|jgi:methenyltetrahydromethanopterin cyclohydrolase|nr:methenyltetrahydromethanopterin cyclohydrolase [Anaerolineae bacterium]
MLSLNQRALGIVQQMIQDAKALDVAVSTLDNGTVVVDAGIDVPGSLEAGLLFARVCLGGLGTVDFCQLPFGDAWLPGVTVSVSHPVVACMASQYAGWAVKAGGFFAMASGPARALYAGEALFEHLAYRDQSSVAVLALEGRDLPPVAAADKVARKCGVAPDQLYLLIAPTASLAGSVQVAARVVETGLHKMHEVGFDINTVISGIGTCPLASLARKDLQAIGRTNDAVLYGGRAWYTVRTDDARVEEVIERLPSCSSRDHGTLFYDLFKRYDGDFYKIDPLLFSPAEVYVNNATSGRTFQAGAVAPDLIRASLLAQ